MKTNARGGVMKSLGRMFTGESIFMANYTAQKDGAMVAFASTVPGNVMPVDLSKMPGGLIFQKGSFLCAEDSIQTSVAFNKKLSTGFFGGEGFILQKAEGNGQLFLEVVKVGKELEKQLEKFKFNVTRSEKKHDYPAYSGSYERSLETIQSMLKKNKDAEIVFDIHRDAIGSGSNYAPTVEINGEKVAQLMFVIGTNDGGGKHPNWKNNLKFAAKVQEKANQMYPGLFRNINLRGATFNQKVTNAASIIEVGATGNTLEEACASMKYLAEILNEVLKN